MPPAREIEDWAVGLVNQAVVSQREVWLLACRCCTLYTALENCMMYRVP